MDDLKVKIAKALMEELETKTLDKITIKDLVNKLGVSRQAFYYHFDDLYAVIEWIFSEASVNILDLYSDILSWQLAFVTIMRWVKNHDKFVINSYKSVSRDYIETFMNKVLSPYIAKVVNTQAEGMNITEDQKSFITRFFTISFNALILDWMKEGMKEDPKDIIDKLEILVDGDFKKALKNFHNRNEYIEKYMKD